MSSSAENRQKQISTVPSIIPTHNTNTFPAGIFLHKINNENTTTLSEVK